MSPKWNYSKQWVDIHMPGYFIRALVKFNQPTLAKPQHAPHPWVTPVYGSRQEQKHKDFSKAPILDKNGTQRVQSIIGTFTQYSRAVDPCILPALS